MLPPHPQGLDCRLGPSAANAESLVLLLISYGGSWQTSDGQEEHTRWKAPQLPTWGKESPNSPAFGWQESVGKQSQVDLSGYPPWSYLQETTANGAHPGLPILGKELESPTNRKKSRSFHGSYWPSHRSLDPGVFRGVCCPANGHWVDYRWRAKGMVNACLRVLFSPCSAWAPKECWTWYKSSLMELAPPLFRKCFR